MWQSFEQIVAYFHIQQIQNNIAIAIAIHLELCLCPPDACKFNMHSFFSSV